MRRRQLPDWMKPFLTATPDMQDQAKLSNEQKKMLVSEQYRRKHGRAGTSEYARERREKQIRATLHQRRADEPFVPDNFPGQRQGARGCPCCPQPGGVCRGCWDPRCCRQLRAIRRGR